MKRLFLLFTFLFVITPVISLSAPNYDPNHKGCVYDDSANLKLFKKLDKEYNEKCYIHISETLSENICGVNSYGEMVLQPYERLKQNFDFNTCEVIKD